MHRNSHCSSNRCGAALIVALVLLALLGIVAGIVLPQILRARHEAQWDLVRAQSRLLFDDALRGAEARRSVDPEFSGETLTLGPDQQPFSGTFLVMTRLENDAFFVEVEYREGKDRVRVQERRNISIKMP